MRVPIPFRRLAISTILASLSMTMTASADAPPVMSPHDLVAGPVTFSQDGQNVTQLRVGMPVTIACRYIVDEAASSFAFAIQPWQGIIQIGGKAPRNLFFPGEPRGGQHDARQQWTPAAAGRTPVSCLLNQGFENAEAHGDNNRWSGVIDIVGDDGDVAPAPAPAPADATDRHPAGIIALAERGKVLAQADPNAASLRDQLLYGFNIGMGGTEGNSLWGPGQQARLNSLTPTEQIGYKVASTYMLERNRNAQLGASGSTTDAAPVMARPKPAVCGDFVVGVGEQCDDGNTDNGDGCSATCQLEQ